GIELEGGKRLSLEFFGRIQTRSRDNHASLDAAARYDLDRGAGVEQRDEAGVGHQAQIHLPHAKEGHLLGESWGIDELQLDAVLFGELHGMRQKDVEIAKAGTMRRLELAG